MVRQRLVLAVVALLVVVAVAGCATILPEDTDSEPDADALLEGTLDGGDAGVVVGERTVEFVDENGDETTTERAWIGPDRYRLETIDSSGGDHEGDVVIDTGSSLLYYDAETGEATVRDSPETVTDGLEATYAGTDTVADRAVHVVDVTVRTESVERGIELLVGDTHYVYPLEVEERDVDLVEQRLWIDEEYGSILKHEQIYEDPDGSELAVAYTFKEVTFEEEFDEELLELPEDAEIVDPDTEQWEFESREEADEATAFDLPDAEFPADYERRGVSADEYEGTVTVHEEYESESGLLWYSVAEEGLMPEEPDRENVGEIDGSVVELDGPTLLTWDCGSVEAELSGPFAVETLLELAEDVPCE